MTVVWHGIQALAECLITCTSFYPPQRLWSMISSLAIVFLVRVLLKSRIGIRKSDNVVNFLVRGAIQTGFLAALWAIGGLVTSFFVPQNLVYRVFDVTSGSVYTHVGVSSLFQHPVLRRYILGNF